VSSLQVYINIGLDTVFACIGVLQVNTVGCCSYWISDRIFWYRIMRTCI